MQEMNETSPLPPDASKETKVDTGYGIVRLIQKSVPEELKTSDDTSVDGMTLCFDPDTVKVAQWEIHPDAYPFIAL